jgi:hypothetical protein
MSDTITLALPDDTLQRYRRGAVAARKPLEEFLIERLMEARPPLPTDLPSPFNEDLTALETMDDETLWQVAYSRLPDSDQDLYNELLKKNSAGMITPVETETLHALGAEARRLTLKKAHAFMLLKWRGYGLPDLDELSDSE